MPIHFTNLPVIQPTSVLSVKYLERKTVPELKELARDTPGYVDSLSKVGLIHLLTGSPFLTGRDLRFNKVTKKDLRYLFDHYHLKVDHSQMTVDDYIIFLRELQTERIKKSRLEDVEKAKIELQELGIKVPKPNEAILEKLKQEKEKRKLQAEKAFKESLNEENLNKLSTEELREIAQKIKRIGYKASFRKYQLIPFILGQRVPTRKPTKTTKKQKVDISYLGPDLLTTLPDELVLHMLRELDAEDLRSVCISNKRLQMLCQERWIQHKIQDLRVFPGRIMSIINADQLYIFGRNKYVLPYLDLVLPSGERPTIKYGSVYGTLDKENNVFYDIPKVILPDYMGLPSGAFALQDDCYFVYNTEGELFAIGNGKLGCLGTGTKGNRRKWTKVKGIRGKVIALQGTVHMKRHATKMEMIHYGEMYALTESGDVYFWGGDRYLTPQLISSEMKFIDFYRNLLISEDHDVYILDRENLAVNPHKLNKEQVITISGNMYLNREGRVIRHIFWLRHIFLPRDRIRTPIQEKFVPTDNLEAADPSIDLLYKEQGKYVYVPLEKLPFDERVIDLVGGMDFKILLTEDGEVYTLGREQGGGLGYRIGHYRGEGGKRVPLPTLVELPEIVQTIAANTTDVAIVTQNKRIFFWGRNNDYPREIRL